MPRSSAQLDRVLIKLCCLLAITSFFAPMTSINLRMCGDLAFFGEDAASIMIDGVVDQVTGLKVSSRVSFNSLWMRDDNGRNQNGDYWLQLLGEVAGPIGGIAQSIL